MDDAIKAGLASCALIGKVSGGHSSSIHASPRSGYIMLTDSCTTRSTPAQAAYYATVKPEKKEPQWHRFHGSVTINARMMAGDAGKIMEEVVKHLTTLYGANVQVTLEIQATVPGGVPDATVRTVTENCRTLRFEGFGFEEE